MYAELTTKGDKVLSVVPGEEAATSGALPAATADLGYRLQQKSIYTYYKVPRRVYLCV